MIVCMYRCSRRGPPGSSAPSPSRRRFAHPGHIRRAGHFPLAPFAQLPKNALMFWPILMGLLPSFLLVILGGGVRNRLSETAWHGLDRLNFEILFPALIFTAAASRPIAPSSLLVVGPLVWAILGAGLALGWLARPHGPARFLDFAGGWQTAWRFNTALGFVVVGALPGADLGLFSVIIGMAIPMANIFAVSALSRGTGLTLRAALKRIALNPFLLASLSGVAVGLSGLTIPEP